MRTEKTLAGLKVYVDDKHVKTMPSRYESIVEQKHILNYTKKRLTSEERWLLEIELFRHNLKIYEPRIFDLIKRSKPKFSQMIRTKTTEYFELVFKNKVRIKCSSEIHHLSINKVDPIYRNY